MMCPMSKFDEQQLEIDVEPVRIDIELSGADAVAFHRAATELRLSGLRRVRTVSGVAREIIRRGCLNAAREKENGSADKSMRKAA